MVQYLREFRMPGILSMNRVGTPPWPTGLAAQSRFKLRAGLLNIDGLNGVCTRLWPSSTGAAAQTGFEQMG